MTNNQLQPQPQRYYLHFAEAEYGESIWRYWINPQVRYSTDSDKVVEVTLQEYNHFTKLHKAFEEAYRAYREKLEEYFNAIP